MKACKTDEAFVRHHLIHQVAKGGVKGGLPLVALPNVDDMIVLCRF